MGTTAQSITDAMNTPVEWPLAFRVILCFFLLLALGWTLFALRVEIGELLIPWLKLVVTGLEARMDVGEFSVIQKKSEYVYHLRLISDQPLQLYDRQFPGMDVSATTLISHSLQQLFILLATPVLALLFIRIKLASLVILLIIFLLIAVAADIPFVLLGSIEGLFLQHLSPEQLDSHWLVQWERFMTNGGRISVSIALAVLAVGLAYDPEVTKL